MSAYDLYGVQAGNIDEALSLVETLLSCSFAEHDSDYHAGRYFSRGEESGEHFMLKYNLDPFENVPAEDNFPEIGLLLYINETGDPRNFKRRSRWTRTP